MIAETIDRGELFELSRSFEGYAHPVRLAIIDALAALRELRVSELALACKISQPHASWHLRILKRAGIVTTRRDGREVFCRLERSAIQEHLQHFTHHVLHEQTSTKEHQPHTVRTHHE